MSSWLSGISGKAESFLNKLDQSAADALHSPENLQHPHVRTSHPPVDQSALLSRPAPQPSYERSLSTSASVPANLNQLKTVKPTPVKSQAASPSPSRNKPKSSDDALFEFLNSTETAEHAPRKKTMTSQHHSRKSSSSSLTGSKDGKSVERPSSTPLLVDTENTGSEGKGSPVSDDTTPTDFVHVENMSPDLSGSEGSHHGNDDTNQSHHQLSSLELENKLLKNEIASLNQEMNTIVHRAKSAQADLGKSQRQIQDYNATISRTEQLARELQMRETDLTNTISAKDSQLAVLRVRLEEADRQVSTTQKSIDSLQTDKDRILQDHTDSSGLQGQAFESLKHKLSEVEASYQRELTAHKKTQEEAVQRQSKLETEQRALAEELSTTQKKLAQEKTNVSEMSTKMRGAKKNLDSCKQELSDYKDKAGRILQSKERLIASLREGSGASGEPVTVTNLEYDSVKQERDIFLEELQNGKISIDNLRLEIGDLESQLQRDSDSAQDEILAFEEQLSEEKQRREEAEQEVTRQKQELQYYLDEINNQKSLMQSRLSEREAEIDRLRNQLTTKHISSTTESELESRVRALTESLIQKQTMLEALSTEKNSLSLQLERLEQQFRDVEAITSRTSSTTVNINDDDEVRHRVPGFLREAPSDTEVARRVKRAANTIDKFSIRLGVFLRRYPIARVFVILYMVMLHLWVMIVLLTYQPEIHGTEKQPHAPDS